VRLWSLAEQTLLQYPPAIMVHMLFTNKPASAVENKKIVDDNWQNHVLKVLH
jgi:hypothetical protein